MEINRIYKMDVLEGLRQLPTSFVDLIVTDPPYNITENEWDKFNDVDFAIFTELWMNECYRISKGGLMLMFWSQQKLEKVQKFHTKWDYKRTVVWNMPNAPIHNQDGLIFTWQPCIVFEKSGDKCVNNGNGFISADVIVESFPINERFGHPTIKPQKLIQKLVEKYSRIGDLVLDPFMGSGTTAVVCKYLGRNYIGFERDSNYYEIAVNRLKGITQRKTLDTWVSPTHETELSLSLQSNPSDFPEG